MYDENDIPEASREEILDEFEEEGYTEDTFEALEYIKTCQICDDAEIISDIQSYLKKYHPDYRLVKVR